MKNIHNLLHATLKKMKPQTTLSTLVIPAVLIISIILTGTSAGAKAFLPTCTNPTITATTTGYACGFGSVAMTATASAGTINWYASSTGGTSLHTGTSYTATALTTSTTFYVDASDNGCVTPTRTAIIAGVKSKPTAVETLTPSPACVGKTLTLTVTPSGGLPPYSYGWSGPDGFATTSTGTTVNTPPLTIDGAGFYNVTVTDSNGCTGTGTALVSVFSNPTLSVVATPNPVCLGNTLSLTSGFNSGGSGVVTYAWTGPNGFTGTGENSAIDNVTTDAAGTYSVTVTDNHGCTGNGTTGSISVITNNADVSVTSNTSICSGSSTTLTASGCSTYNWNPGTGISPTTGSTVTANPSATTTYTVTGITGNCSQKATVTVSILPTYSVTASAGSNGSISSPGNTNVCSGSTMVYTVTPTSGYHIVDVQIDGTSIGNTPPFVVTNVTTTHSVTAIFAADCVAPAIACTGNISQSAAAGACSATVTYTAASATGTSPSITYSKASGTTFNVGVTTVTATATNSCGTASCDFNVTITPNTLSVSESHSNVSCHGGNNGSVTTTASGGTGSYSYSWTGGASGAGPTGLSAGVYTVTVTDNGCSAVSPVSKVVTITEPATLSITSLTPYNVSCNSANSGEHADGSITTSVTGGTGAYSYSWTGGATVDNPNGLTAGTYSVTVTDENGCTASGSAVVGAPAPLSVTSSVTNVTCHGGNNGSITIASSGGTSGYTGTGTFSSLAAGSYSYTVTDANGCSSSVSTTVTEPTALNITSISAADVSCNAANGGNHANGSISASVSGGTGSYSYSWTGGASGANPTGLAPGTYSVTVTDANNCSVTGSSAVSAPSALTASTSVTNVTCHGGNNGTVTVSASGGTTGYTGTGSFNSLTAGDYSNTVTDAHGCTATVSSTVTEPAALSITSITTADVSCNAANGGNHSNGSITTTVSGGTGTYTYSWTGAAAGANPTGLAAGTYSVTVSDANNCSATGSAAVSAPSALTASTSVTNVTCYGGNNGSVTVSASGGTSGYTGTGSFNSLTAGDYSYTVTDAHGCTATASSTVAEPAALSITSITATDISCNTANGGNHTNGSITTSVSGGTGSYSYSWTGGASGANPSALSAGTYSVTVTDASNCTVTGSATVGQPAQVSVSLSATNVSCNSANGGSSGNGAVTSSVSGGAGTYSYVWSNGGSNSGISGLSVGTYSVTVTDANSCSKASSASVTQPTALSVTLTPTNVSCGSTSNGSIAASVSGGTSGYTYAWSNSQSGSTNTGLSAGTYSVTVTDAHSCTKSASAAVTTYTTTTVSISGSTSVLGNVATVYTAPSGLSSYSWSLTGGDHVCDPKCHHNSSHSCGSGCDHYGGSCPSGCHHHSGHSCGNTHTGDHHCSKYCHHNSAHTCDAGCDHNGQSCSSACHHNSGHYCNHQHCGGPYFSGSATGSSVTVISPCCANAYTVSLTGTGSGGCTSTAGLGVTVTPSATITVYSSLYVTGSGNHPGVTKSALASSIKVYNRHTSGARDGSQSHYASVWNSTSGQIANAVVSSPVSVNLGGGPAYQYVITVPAFGHYLVVGQSVVSSTKCGGTTCTIYTAKRVGGHDDVDADDHDRDDDDESVIGSCTNSVTRFHAVLKDQTGRCIEADTHKELGSLMLVVSPMAVEFTDSVSYLPVVYESVEGDWSVSVSADPPYGFYTEPAEALSTSVTDSVINAVQFSIIDTGSDWTFTSLKHSIQHKGESRTAYSKPSMVNFRTNKPTEINILPNPADDQIKIIMPKFEGKATVYIYNMLGQKVAEQPINVISGASVSMDIAALPPGVYLVSAQNSSGKASGRLVKQQQ